MQRRGRGEDPNNAQAQAGHHGGELRKRGRPHGYQSDAKGPSLGLAQWNDRGRVDISAKVWRYTGEKWSRQSEELPLHRVLDLAILICRARGYFADAYRYPKLYDENDPQIDRHRACRATR